MSNLIYKKLLFPLFSWLDPEIAHDFLRALAPVANLRMVENVLHSFYQFEDPRLITKVAGLTFKNPVGLAAGFDKNAEMLALLSAVGFSHLELGTVTPNPQPGNPKPRIFRLKNERSLINRMGFPSHGAERFALRVEKRIIQTTGQINSPIIGINIGKAKLTELDKAVDDYLSSFNRLHKLADYVAVNVSSPNTAGLRQLQTRERLTEILLAIKNTNADSKPIFVKLSPDLSDSDLEDALLSCHDTGVSGVIATNTTLDRTGVPAPIRDEAGGLSGELLRERALQFVRRIGERKGSLQLIASGGISTSSHIIELLKAGASLVQIYSTLIFEGPSVVNALCRDLSKAMDQEGVNSLRELSVNRSL